MSKKKLKEHTKRLQRIVEKLKRRNYYLGQEGRILREFIRNYKDWYRVWKTLH